MAEITIVSLSIQDPAGRPIANRFLRPKKTAGGPATALALLLPGLRYTNDMPLLYYTGKLLLARDVDVLLVDSHAETPTSLSPAERAARLFVEGEAAWSAGWNQGNYRQLVLVGKSIGTLTLAHLATKETGRQAVTIWLTPLLRQDYLLEAARQAQGPALYIAGSSDPTFDEAALASLINRPGSAAQAEALLIEGANHSLEIPGDPLESINSLAEIMATIAAFLDRRLAASRQ